VSSWDTKHNTISAFFASYPTPSHLLDADPEDVLQVIKPLGLFPTRMQSLVAISTRFLELPEFIVGLNKEHKIYGIGEFGYQSYQIFCQNKGLTISPADRALASFASWQKQLAKNAAEDATASDVKQASHGDGNCEPTAEGLVEEQPTPGNDSQETSEPTLTSRKGTAQKSSRRSAAKDPKAKDPKAKDPRPPAASETGARRRGRTRNSPPVVISNEALSTKSQKEEESPKKRKGAPTDKGGKRASKKPNGTVTTKTRNEEIEKEPVRFGTKQLTMAAFFKA